MIKALHCALFFFAAYSAGATTPSTPPPATPAVSQVIHLALTGRAIRVNIDNREGRIDLDSYVNAAALRQGKILFCRRTRGIIYLVVDLGGPSKIPVDAAHCGDGEESNMVWIKLASDLKPIEIQSTLYESCWQSVSYKDHYKTHGDELDLRFTDFANGHGVENWLHYNNRSPDAGFVVLKMN